MLLRLDEAAVLLLEYRKPASLILTCQVVYIAPFANIIISVQLHVFDDTLEDAARDCDASIWDVYKEVTLPLIWPGISALATLIFILGLNLVFVAERFRRHALAR